MINWRIDKEKKFKTNPMINDSKVVIKIISGVSHEGGSTNIFIRLTNELNKRGFDVTFYGPHDYHLDKCKSKKIITPHIHINDDDLNIIDIQPSDILIFHYKILKERPKAKKVIFVSHEKNWFEMSQITKYWDIAVFSHEKHRKYHNYNEDYLCIPNPKEELFFKDKKELSKIAGIIGTIEERKQTHISIQKALDDGMEKIYLFGRLESEPNYSKYYLKYVHEYIDEKKVFYKGFSQNKQEMYNQIGNVYAFSGGEVATLVKDECYQTGTKFIGNEETNHEVSLLTNYEITNKWIELFDLKEERNINNFYKNIKFAVIIHIFYEDLMEYIIEKLKNIPISYDLYVSIPYGKESIKEKILKYKNDAIIEEVPNRGQDVAPFIYFINKIIENNKDYDIILKMHSKKSPLNESEGNLIRNILYDKLLSNSYIIRDNINLFENIHTGMVGYSLMEESIIDKSLGKNNNKEKIDILREMFNVKDDKLSFFYGTMFYVRFDILKETFKNIKLDYDFFEEGYKIDNHSLSWNFSDGTFAHAFERFFANIVRDKKYELIENKNILYTKKRLCIFVYYGYDKKMPYHIEIYLKELNKHFDDVLIVTNNVEIETEYPISRFENEGGDFGLWYKIIKNLDLSGYKEIALVNDSCILFNTLDKIFEWSQYSQSDFWGITDSYENFDNINRIRHLQSYFLVFKEKSLQYLKEFFNDDFFDSINKDLTITENKTNLIIKGEIGLSDFMIKKGMIMDAYFKSNEVCKKFNKDPFFTNMTILLYKELIKDGCPLIKKKIVRKDSHLIYLLENDIIDKDYFNYEDIIREYMNVDIDFQKLFNI